MTSDPESGAPPAIVNHRAMDFSGEGLSGPNLTSATARHDLAAIAAFIKDPKPPMPDLHPSPLDDAEVAAIAEYVRTLQGGQR